MKPIFRSTGLNDAGSNWLKAPPNLPTQPLHISDWIQQIARTFGFTTREALLVLCAMFSAAAGPSGLVRDPFGRAIPLSLQLLIHDDASSNLALAMNAFGQWILEGFNRTIGRRRPNIGVAAANERKKLIFPIGGILTARLAEELVIEDGDCSFASFSDAIALRAFLRIPKDHQDEYDQFLYAGWSGNGVSGHEGHPIFPAVSLTWSASTPMVTMALKDGLLDRLPGLLVVSPMNISTPSNLPTRLHDHTLEQWGTFLTLILEKMRIPHKPKHSSQEGPLVRQMEDNALDAVASTASFVGRYSNGDGIAAQLLQQAPVQIAKLSSLLSLYPSPDSLISLLHVQYAQEIYRGLIASTLHAVQQADNLRAGSFYQERAHIETKLSAFGAMTIKQITAEQPKQELGKVQAVLRLLMEERVVSCNDKGLYSLSMAPML